MSGFSRIAERRKKNASDEKKSCALERLWYCPFMPMTTTTTKMRAALDALGAAVLGAALAALWVFAALG